MQGTSRLLCAGLDKTEDYFECAREEMLEFVPPSARTILEVGCGAGGFGGALRRQGQREVWGVEVNPAVAKRAASQLDRVLVGEFPTVVELPERYFDCVVFNDVLEHMIDPWGALRATRRLLTEGGVVVASIPNVRYLPLLYKLLVRGDWTYAPSGVLDSTHLRFFTVKSMREMFDRMGYDVIRIEGLFADTRWQVKVLELLLPGFVREAKYIDYAVVARPRTSEGDLAGA
jgi:2-polyprenyl-3-methyl-5-hydroxy-6-metoxy-1,4-benzoquinol methylase